MSNKLDGYRKLGSARTEEQKAADKEDASIRQAEAEEGGYETKEEELKVDPEVTVPTGDEEHPTRGPENPMDARKALYEKGRKHRELITREDSENHPGAAAVQAAVEMAAGGEERAGSEALDTNQPGQNDSEQRAELLRQQLEEDGGDEEEPAETGEQEEEEPPLAAEPEEESRREGSDELKNADESPTVLVKVYGETYEVPRQDVDDAGGIEAYQKARAANIRLQDLATKEADLRKREKALRDQEKRSKPSEKQADPSHADGRGDADAEVDSLTRELLTTVVDSEADPDAIKDWVRKNLSEARAKVAAEQAPPSDPAEQQSIELSPAEQELRDEMMRDRIAANRMMREEFPDIIADQRAKARGDGVDGLFVIARQRYERLARDPSNAGRTQREIAREAALWARRASNTQPAPRERRQPNAVEEERQQRIVRKRKLPQPSRADARKPHQPEQPEKSTQQRRREHFARIRRAQGRDLPDPRR